METRASPSRAPNLSFAHYFQVPATQASSSGRHHWSPREMTSEQRLQKLHTIDVHYPDLGNAPDWLKQISLVTRPIRSTTQIWVVTRNQYGISANGAQTSFGGKTCGRVVKCRLFLRLSVHTSHEFLFSLYKSEERIV